MTFERLTVSCKYYRSLLKVMSMYETSDKIHNSAKCFFFLFYERKTLINGSDRRESHCWIEHTWRWEKYSGNTTAFRPSFEYECSGMFSSRCVRGKITAPKYKEKPAALCRRWTRKDVISNETLTPYIVKLKQWLQNNNVLTTSWGPDLNSHSST